MTKPKARADRLPPGRPRLRPLEETQARQRALWRTRNRALSILAQRHPTEFLQIKEELLANAGEPPLVLESNHTPPRVTLDIGLDDL